MVTLNYLRRFLKFLQPVFHNTSAQNIPVSSELHSFFSELSQTFSSNQKILSSSIDNNERKVITNALGIAGSNFRNKIYEHGFSGTKENISASELLAFVNTSLEFIEHSIKANKRKDNLYHAYNLLSFENDGVTISHLSEMLEGQVAVLSSGLLAADESLQLLDALRQSALYRKDQNSYILYPNKALHKFAEKNSIPPSLVKHSTLLSKMVHDYNTSIIEKDVKGAYHFNGNFKNAGDLAIALDNLGKNYSELAENDKASVLQIFEDVFNHKEFTGRSGTFYAFEGLGSIYWHMVSKLLLAVQETCLRAISQHADKEIVNRLIAHYYEINEGIGVHKSPKVYGAFPITPYSHTPLHKGAQQPGMTGQVKEDILCRMGEFGVNMKNGQLTFDPVLLRRNEFLSEAKETSYVDVLGTKQSIKLEKDSLFFTYCQVPVKYVLSDDERIEIERINGSKDTSKGLILNDADTKLVLQRTGSVKQICVFLNETRFRN
jgi:hypothetical protein